MIERIKTTGMSREAWLAERRKSVGGSEVGAVLGLNPWASPYSVWANKTGRLPDAEPNEAMRQGTDLENYVARRFMEASGLRVERENAILRNSDFPHLHANIDRRIIGAKAGLECKTASALNASRFHGGEFPVHYYAQCVAYMAVTGYRTYYLAVLVLGKEFKIFRMTRDQGSPLPEWCESSVYVSPEEFAALKEAVADFWGYVERDQEPPVDGLEVTGEALGAVYSEPHEACIDLFGHDADMERFLTLKAEIKALEAQRDACANSIKQCLGNATQGQSSRYTVAWKPQTRRTFDAKRFSREHPELNLDKYYKTSETRVFSVKEA